MISDQFLFIDTTVSLSLGLYSKEGKFTKFELTEDRRPSGVFHYKVFNFLESAGLEISKLEGIIYIAGPGSYTGMRLSEGFCKILERHGKKVYSIYHHEIPLISGDRNYTYIANAFKNEFFISKVTNGEINNSLVDYEEVKKNIDNSEFRKLEKIYSNEQQSIVPTEMTSDLIRTQPNILSSIIRQDIRRRPFYYRASEVEFRPKYL